SVKLKSRTISKDDFKVTQGSATGSIQILNASNIVTNVYDVKDAKTGTNPIYVTTDYTDYQHVRPISSGPIVVRGGDVLIRGTKDKTSSLNSTNGQHTLGGAGRITVEANALTLSNRGTIDVSTKTLNNKTWDGKQNYTITNSGIVDIHTQFLKI